MALAWNNPEEVGRLSACFERQSHSDRFLCVLDDGAQYQDQPSGDRWQVVSINRRFRSMGEKRAACCGLAPADSEGICVWDSDDLYLPHALAACSRALERGAAWGQCRQSLEWLPDGTWSRCATYANAHPDWPAYHSAWAYRRDAYVKAGGYPPQGDEDWILARKVKELYGPSADTICPEFPDPWMAYSRGPGHISTLYQKHQKNLPRGHTIYDIYRTQQDAWDEKGREEIVPCRNLHELVKLDRNYSAIPIPAELSPRPW
jgi:hypothetical protein